MSAKKSAKGSAKGAKESKAEKQRLQKEEDERRLQEEEEARLQAEKEQQERLERERREQEEMQRLEAKDQDRREDELNEVRHLLEENQTAVKKWRADTREKAKWVRFMRCDGRPDPSVTQEVNTYISLWRDDPEVNASPALQQCSLALQLIEALEEEQEEAQEEERQRVLDHIHCLQDLVHHKHLLIAQEVLNHASSNVDIESGNMERVVRDDHVTLCVWANLNKNPRFKGFHFVEAGLAFQLPRVLALSDVALRLLHTRYDHLSPRASLTALGDRPPSTRGEEQPSSTPASPDQGDSGGAGGEVGEEERQSPTHGTEEEEVRSVHGSVERKSAGSVRSERSSSSRPVEEPENQTQLQMEAGEEVPAAPEPEIVEAVAVATVDLHRYTPLGGVFYCDVFRLPPQANPAKGWEVRQVLEGGLEALPYPEGSSETPPDSSPRAPEPLGLSLTVPDCILLLEAPHVARWDPTAKRWTTAGVSDVSYEADHARVSFKMESFRAFVLMKETYDLLPPQDWSLEPLGPDSARLSVKTAPLSLSVTVQGHQCMLQVEQQGVLAHLQGRWMGCRALQKAMANAGLNLFVNEHTDRYVRSCGKDPLSEHTVYEQMALLASAAAFSWSRWNARCGGEHMVLQACEHQGPAPVPGGRWSLYLLGAQRSQKLQMSEGSAAFSAELSPDAEFHSTFVHTLRDDLSPGGVAKTRNAHFLFVDTVQTLLCDTRLLNYC